MLVHVAMELRTRLIHLIVLALLILGSLAPIASFGGGPAAAQPVCGDGEVWSEEAQACVAGEDEQPGEEAQPAEVPALTEPSGATEVPAEDGGEQGDEGALQATETATEDGQAAGGPRVEGGSVSFHLRSMWCPSGFDPRTADRGALDGTCHAYTGEIRFSLSANGEAVEFAGASGGTATSNYAPPGDFSMSQTVPRGFSGPAAFICRQGGVTTNTHEYPLPGGGGSFVFLGVPAGTGWICDSYMVLIPAGEITVYVFGCPEGYDIYSKGPDELKAACTGQFEGTEFVLEHPTDGISHAYTSSFSRASFVNVSPGQVRLREAMPNGYGVPVIFCQVNGPDGQTFEQYDKYNVANNASIGLGMDELEFVGCDVFQAPGGQRVETPMAQEGFPQGLPLSPQDQAQPIGTPVAGVGDQVVPAGEQAEEVVEVAGATPVLGEDDAEPVGGVEGVLEPGFPIGFDPAAANLASAPGSSYVSVYMRACPVGVEAANMEAEELFGMCPELHTGVGFVLLVDNDTVGAATMGPEGYALIGDAPAGEFVIAGALTLGFGTPVVGCNVVDRPSGTIVFTEFREYLASPEGAITVPGVGVDQGVYCIWFNMPTAATGAVDVVAWGCPEGYDLGAKGPDELIGDCGQKLDAVGFQLQHPTDGVTMQMTAGPRSTAYFRNVRPGQVTLKEIMPRGYGGPVVFCEARGPAGQTIDQYDRYDVSNSASVQLGMDEFDHFRCDFFQVPGLQPLAVGDVPLSPEGSPGTVTILSYECPEGFDADGATANEINLRCAYAQEAVFEYSLIDGAGGLDVRHTGLKEPFLTFEGVAPGAISVTAAAPYGFGEPVVYCQVIGAGGEAPGPYERVPLAAPHAIEQTLGASEWLACDWFNVPKWLPFDDVQSEVRDVGASRDADAEDDAGEDGP